MDSKIISLEKQIAQLAIENKILKDKIQNLETSFMIINQQLDDIQNKRNENYYQKFLEKYFNASHQKTKFGITDISTNNQHIEIKHWRNYKAALGQLLSYNFDNNKLLAVYFFGSISDDQKQNIIELFHSKNVSVYEFVDGLKGIKINTLYDCTIEKEMQKTQEQTFEKWIIDKVYFCQDSYMNLEEICIAFLGKSNLHSSIKIKI